MSEIIKITIQGESGYGCIDEAYSDKSLQLLEKQIHKVSTFRLKQHK